ncbi:MAG: MATE family efflux transporter [Spirochaetales bacterium]|nr:MATE family efflux transporter [Spirochaetales bacterium]
MTKHFLPDRMPLMSGLKLPLPGQNKTLRPLLKVAVPVMLANGAETVYNLTDSWFLGRLGPAELSAPSIAFNFIMLIILAGQGIAAAGTTLISRAVGQKNREKAEFFLGQVAGLLVSSAVVLAVLGWFLTVPFLKVLQTPDELFAMTASYMRIICAGVPFMYGFFIMQSAMEGTGNTMAALRIQLLATAVNIPLDGFLIFGIGPVPALGVEGAALATVISRMIAAVLGIIILLKGRQGIRLRLKNTRYHRETMGLLIRVAVPSSLSQMGSSLGFAVLHSIINSFGTTVIAAFGVVNRIQALFYMPVQGLARGTTTLVGQSLGAGENDRTGSVVRTAVHMSLIYIIPGMVFCFFYGSLFIRFFIDDPAVVAEGASLFRINSASVIVFAVFMILAGAFQGAGDTRSLMYMHLGRLWVLRLPLAWLAAYALGMGPKGVWYAMAVSNLMITIIGIYRFRSGRWVYALKAL